MKTKFAVSAMLLCITSTVALAQQVSVNYSPNQDFSQFHTYAWGSRTPTKFKTPYSRR